MGSLSEVERVAFDEKVTLTVYLDKLPPQVTEFVMRKALDQFGTIKSVQFIENYTELRKISQFASVEMENSKQANAIVSQIAQFPFIVMSGVPRPIRAYTTEAGMFEICQTKSERGTHCQWLDPNYLDFQVARKLKIIQLSTWLKLISCLRYILNP